MLCSICGQAEIVLDVGEAVICPNSHVHCGKCLKQVIEKCLICKGRLHKYSWTGLQASETRNWSPELILEWSHKNALISSMSEDSLEKDMNDSVEDCEGASMNLLYSRSKACDGHCLQSSDSKHLLVSKNNHSPLWNNTCDKPNHFLDADPKCSRLVQSPFEADNNLGPGRKDTRQNLLEQTQQELRKKIMDGIFKSYRTDQKRKLLTDDHTKQLRTIGVSTESTPKLLPDESLKASSLESSKETMSLEDSIAKQSLYNTAPPEYVLMNVGATSVKTPLLQDDAQKKSKTSNIDLRLQQIMGILLESEKPPSKEDQHFYTRLREKFSRMPLGKLEEIISSIYNEGDDEKKTEVKNAPNENDVIPEKPLGTTAIANCRRGYYNPPVETKTDTTPDPQFQLISMCNVNISKELLQTEIIDGTLNIPRKPVICPISTCQRMCFVSDFTKHIADYHAKEPMCIFPQQYKNFFLDPKLIHFGSNRCQFLLLVKNKIMNLGHEKFKNFIPILVMTTKLSLLEICSNQYRAQSEEVRKSTQNFVMIWLTGIMPPQLPIFFSLTVWARSGYMPACHLVHSGRVFSVSESQSPEAVRQSGQMLLLSNDQIDFLTNGGRHMLELQITVH